MKNKGCGYSVYRNNEIQACGLSASYSGVCDQHLKDVVRNKQQRLHWIEHYHLRHKPNDNNYLREQEKVMKWLLMYRAWLLKHPDKALEL